MNGLLYSTSKCMLPEGNYTTTTLVSALCDVMNAHCPFDPPAGILPSRFEPHANLVNIMVSIYTGTNKFERLTDEQAVAEI